VIATRSGVALIVVLAIGFGCGGSTDNARENSGGHAGSSGTGATGGTRAGQNGTGGDAGSGAVGGGGASGSGGAAGVSSGGSAGSGGTANGSDAGATDAGPADLCDYPPETGSCNAAFARFYFDPGNSQCREFTWGGCGGNANNFETREACEAACEHRADTCLTCVPGKGCAGTGCGRCPPRADADGQPCSDQSLACSFDSTVGCVTCGCTYDPSVGRVWRCAAAPCPL